MTRLLSPHNNIIYIIYPKKFYFSIHISSLSLSNNPRKYLYIKKNFYTYSYMFIYLFIYNINIHKNLFLPKKFRNLQFISYIIIIIIIKISRITIKSLSLANYPENNILWIRKINVNSFSEVFNNSTKIYNIYNINNINHTKSII